MKDELGLTQADYRRLKIQQKIRNFLNSKCLLPTYMFYFGAKKAWRLNKVKQNRMNWLNECYDILQNDFSEFIKNYHFVKPNITTRKKYIWVCWLQGEAFMPEIVNECIKSIRKNGGGAEVVLITGKNLKRYVEFPDFIYRKLKIGSLDLTHFSDLIRMELLRKYGGLWLDATIFVSSPIPESYFEKQLYSIQMLDKENRYKNIYYGSMTSFLLGGKNECMLFDFCYSFFVEYLKRYNNLIDVHWINLAIRMAYENFPEVQLSIDEIGVNNGNVQELMKAINSPYNVEKYRKISNKQIFHKLNWRKEYHEIANGKITIYGYIKQNLE